MADDDANDDNAGAAGDDADNLDDDADVNADDGADAADETGYADDDANDDANDAVDDDFYSNLGNATDDYWRHKDSWQNNYYDDNYDDGYYSAQKTTSWIDKFLSNTTARQDSGTLTPVADVNPDNVLATLVFNAIVCVILLAMYELLRRYIPSVYSQRLVHERKEFLSSVEVTDRCSSVGGVIETCVDTQLSKISQMKASGRSLYNIRWGDHRSVMNLESTSEEAGENIGEMEVVKPSRSTDVGLDDTDRETSNGEYGAPNIQNGDADECARRPTNVRNGESCTKEKEEGEEEPQSWISRLITRCWTRPRSFPVLEWCIPVHRTPWSALRRSAGLDAYFFLRYIRMCLKITAVSSFWAMVVLCPVYATGGGDQSGFYHVSMANVLPGDRGRVWVPTIFCWAFTMYCWFCIRGEMMHYVDIRMQFLGGEEEEKILKRRQMTEGRLSSAEGKGGYVTPEELSVHTKAESDTNESDEQRSRSRSPLLDGDGPDSQRSVAPTRGRVSIASEKSVLSQRHRAANATKVQKQLKQHRYSLQVEKVPVELRSNTALFNYFNDIFPGQVHSACMAMNVPDLDAFSARRMRVCRRLEKSLAYYSVTGIRPTHIAGRPRCKCCGIESTPIDGWCVACCCFYDSNRMNSFLDEDDPDYPTKVYDMLPAKGECVDSILYYTRELANCNLRMKKLQDQKFHISETGNSPMNKFGGSFDDGKCDWYVQPLGMLKTTAAVAAEGLREEFEVSGEEDYLGDQIDSGYGSTAISYTCSSAKMTDTPAEKSMRLVTEDHLPDGDLATDSNGEEGEKLSLKSKGSPRGWIRAILWRMGVDFLAAGLDVVRNQTDVVVDSVTRPSMSSTGFVTFRTLTPVTVTTSSPLTYERNPMEVSVAPEPRDLVWKNVQIDRDIGASREFVANALLGMGVLLWSIPLTLIQAWAKVENVARIPGLEWVDQIHDGAWKSLINGYLPVITLLGLILILPLLFQWVATSIEKRKTLSGVQDSIVGRYFYYQLANIYITVTAGALWTSLAEIIDHPQKLLVILGRTLPKLAGYFISLLITKILAGLPMVLLRGGALSRMMFMRSCFNKKRLTPRELMEVYRKQPLFYGWEYPTQFLVIIICFTYACITPIVLPVGAVYYFVALLVYKKQALYVYTPTYESGGQIFPQAVSKTLFALLISQLTFLGYTLIRKGVFQIILLFPLPFLTVFFNIFINNRYVNPSKKLSLERAVRIDALLDQSPDFSDEAYQQPVLTEKASVPFCDTNDSVVAEVIENLGQLQDEESDTSRIV